jgi:hypothetical protein
MLKWKRRSQLSDAVLETVQIMNRQQSKNLMSPMEVMTCLGAQRMSLRAGTLLQLTAHDPSQFQLKHIHP